MKYRRKPREKGGGVPREKEREVEERERERGLT